MYNRYIRNQQGNFTRIQEDAPDPAPPFCGPPPPPPSPPPPHCPAESAIPLIKESNHLIRKILNKLGMGNIDTGDLLLLLILFLLFSEGGEKDEELMIALGLLLIL